MKVRIIWISMIVALAACFTATAFCERLSAVDSLMVFAGAASKPPTEEAAKAFEAQTGVKVDVIFGGSGYVLAQMMLGKKGDIYFPGSSDFMETAKKKKVVYEETERKVVYLVPAINVRKRQRPYPWEAPTR